MSRRATTYTISNARSACRLLAAAALTGHRRLFVVLALVSLGTDAVDGIIARWRREETALGARLNALADSLTLAAGLTGVRVFASAPFADTPFRLVLFLRAALATAPTRLKFGKLPPAFHLISVKAANIGMTASMPPGFSAVSCPGPTRARSPSRPSPRWQSSRWRRSSTKSGAISTACGGV